MGIKFDCPNGHSLNVKDFLAGKRGICPQCQTKFIIPLQSGGQALPAPNKKERTGPLTVFDDDAAAAAVALLESSAVAPVETPANPPANLTPLASSPAPVVPQAAPAVTSAPTPPAAAPLSAQPMGTPVQPQLVQQPVVQQPIQPTYPSAPVSPPMTFAPAPRLDPIDEAPQAIWYVRPPSGGQFGPAVGEIMRKWLGEGRVSADSWVWREGWTDWSRAGAVWPRLEQQAGQGSAAAIFDPSPSAAISTGAAAPVQRIRSKRAANQLTLLLVAIMVVIAIGLVAIFLWVVNRQPAGEKPAARAARASCLPLGELRTVEIQPSGELPALSC